MRQAINKGLILLFGSWTSMKSKCSILSSNLKSSSPTWMRGHMVSSLIRCFKEEPTKIFSALRVLFFSNLQYYQIFLATLEMVSEQQLTTLQQSSIISSLSSTPQLPTRFSALLMKIEEVRSRIWPAALIWKELRRRRLTKKRIQILPWRWVNKDWKKRKA